MTLPLSYPRAEIIVENAVGSGQPALLPRHGAPHGLAGQGALHKFSVMHHQGSVDQHVRDAFGALGGILEGGLVDDAGRIEHGDVGVGARRQAAFRPACRGGQPASPSSCAAPPSESAHVVRAHSGPARARMFPPRADALCRPAEFRRSRSSSADSAIAARTTSSGIECTATMPPCLR